MSPVIEKLGPPHLEALRALLGRDLTHNLFLLGIFDEFGIVPRPDRAPFAYYGRFDQGQLQAALFVGGDGGLVIPSAGEAGATSAIAEHLAGSVTLKAALGEKASVDGLVKSLCKDKPRVSKLQRLFAVSADDLGPFTNPTLRLAQEEDLPRLLPLAVEAVRETLGRDPLEEDPEAFQSRVARRVQAKRTYVLEEQETLIFKVDVGCRSASGAELEGLYTAPAHRRQGHATLCLGQICRHLLSSLPRLTLRLDDQDAHLAEMARKVGFLPGRPQRFVLAD